MEKFGRKPFRRTLWGMSPDGVDRLLQSEENRLETQLAELRQELEREQQEHRRLGGQVEQLQRQTDVLRRVTGLLTGILARERSAAPVLDRLRLLEARHLAVERERTRDRQRQEAARLTAEVRQERADLEKLVTDLQAIATGRRALRHAQAHEARPPVNSEPTAGADDTTPRDAAGDWREFLLGRRLQRSLRQPDGVVVAEAAAPVTAETIAKAEKAGLLLDLFLAAN